MPDMFTKKKRSEIMSKIRGKNTRLEARGWLLLQETGVRFRKHPAGIFGKPDAGNKRRKIAVFFDSEFWHGYRWKERKKEFRSRKRFWIPKIERNIMRDRLVNRTLRKQGWTVIRIWEKDLRKAKVLRTLRKVQIILDSN